MKRSHYIIVLVVVMCSCKEESIDNCSVKSPLEQLPWLADEISSLQSSTTLAPYFYIAKAKYRGNTVFIIENCCALCNTITIVFNCEGNMIGYVAGTVDAKPVHLGTVTLTPIVNRDLSSHSILWKPDKFGCVL